MVLCLIVFFFNVEKIIFKVCRRVMWVGAQVSVVSGIFAVLCVGVLGCVTTRSVCYVGRCAAVLFVVCVCVCVL